MTDIKIRYLRNDQPIIKEICLNLYETCPIINCGFNMDCAGKRETRDNEFTCRLEELKKLYLYSKNKP